MARRDEKREARRTSAREWAGKQQKGFEPTCIKLPEDVELYKIPSGTVVLDFLPFLAGKNNPHADEGMEHFERTYDAHRIETPDGGRLYACRKKCFGEACAVCDWLKENGRTEDPDLVKELRAKTRHLWIVNDDPGSKEVVPKVMDTNHFNRGLGFGEQMAELINSLEEDVDPFSLKDGYKFVLKVKEETKPFKWNNTVRIDLRPRKYDYPSSLLKEMPCLDDMIVDPGYDEVMELLSSAGTVGSSKGKHEDNGEETKSRPATRGDVKRALKKKDDDDDEDDDEDQTEFPFSVGDTVDHDKHGVCTVVHVSKDGTSLRIKDEDGDIHNAIDPDDCTEAVEEKPPKKGKAKAQAKKPGRKSSKDEDEEEEDDSEEDEDEPEEEDSEDEDEDSEEEDEPEDEPEDEDPPAKKGRGRPRK